LVPSAGGITGNLLRSSTHVATGSIMDTGMGKKGAEVRWNVADCRGDRRWRLPESNGGFPPEPMSAPRSIFVSGALISGLPATSALFA